MTHATPAAPAQPCAQCPHRHHSTHNDFASQLTQLIAELTPTERTQMVALIDDILAKSRQANSATAKQKDQRRKKR
ncbi:hypothetical protein V8J88_01920 [Massilia sp. W12]|uniref:hypothetical protein n=1 Tax=Massilia sp. W12 TaxID=3126507 RepID=UPI0030D493EB